MSLSLKDLATGDRGRVVGYEQSRRSYRKKLLSMGLTPGTRIEVTRVAPMGDPVELSVRDFKLTLRRDEASVLLVERLG